MTMYIPSAIGVPGISGPPNWLTAPPTVDFRLDDVRWNGATKRTFGGGASQSASFHAIHSTVGAQKYLYLSFRAAFVPGLADQNDKIYIGLQKAGTTDAMVLQMQIHDIAFTPSGPPSANPPALVVSSQRYASPAVAGGVWSTFAAPSWVGPNARVWLQSDTDVPTDPHNRWALQLRVPIKTVGGIADADGANVGDDFNLWYLISGSVSSPFVAPIILGDSRTSGATTVGQLINAQFPSPGLWELAHLGRSGAASGGVSLSSLDIGTSDGTGIKPTSGVIANGTPSIFVARPKNYSAAQIVARFHHCRPCRQISIRSPIPPLSYVAQVKVCISACWSRSLAPI